MFDCSSRGAREKVKDQLNMEESDVTRSPARRALQIPYLKRMEAIKAAHITAPLGIPRNTLETYIIHNVQRIQSQVRILFIVSAKCNKIIFF